MVGAEVDVFVVGERSELTLLDSRARLVSLSKDVSWAGSGESAPTLPPEGTEDGN